MARCAVFSVKQTTPDFYLIAHSHGVSLLDGISDWRKRFRVGGEHDPRYGDAFQGWFNGSMIGEPFPAVVVDKSLPLGNLEAWLLSDGAGVGALARFDRSNGSGVLHINRKFSGVLQTWNGSSPIVSMLNGNEHALTMLNRMPSYDFLDPEIPAIETSVPIIDEIYIDQCIDSWTSVLFYSLVAIKRLAQNQLIHILPPPPRENPQLSQHFETLRDQVVAHGFLPDRLRLKWYRRYCRHLTALLAPINCKVLEPPPESCNSNGLLKEEYAEGLTHGNSKYGKLIAMQLAIELGSKKLTPSTVL
jgi:hypothetical protein